MDLPCYVGLFMAASQFSISERYISLCCQRSVNVRVKILVCGPCWDRGAVAANFTACSCCRPQPVLSIQHGIRGDLGLGCGAVTAVTVKCD